MANETKRKESYQILYVYVHPLTRTRSQFTGEVGVCDDKIHYQKKLKPKEF